MNSSSIRLPRSASAIFKNGKHDHGMTRTGGILELGQCLAQQLLGNRVSDDDKVRHLALRGILKQ